jgi:hypothetical protein
MLKWPRCGFHQKDVGTRYVQLVFLYPMVSSGHVVYSGASRAQNMLALFFMLEWDTLHQTCTFLHLVGSVGHVVHSGASSA